MNKLYNIPLIGLAIMFGAATAFAFDYDNMHMGSIPAHSSIEKNVKFPTTDVKIDVRATNDVPISCSFIDAITGEELARQSNVKSCVAFRSPPKDVIPGEYVAGHTIIKITNDNDNEIDYRIWTHSIK